MDKEKALTIWLPVIADGVKDLPECKESLEMATEALENQKTLLEELEEIKAEAEEQNEDNWFAEMEEAEKRYEHEKWVESFDKGENNES